MAKQTIGLGAAPDDGNGDPLRTAFDKTNDNFDELYSRDIAVEDVSGAKTPRLRIQRGLPIGGSSTTVTLDGVGSFNSTGTLTGRAIASTTALTAFPRVGVVSAGTAGSLASFRNAGLTQRGGPLSWRATWMFGLPSALPASGRAFFGMYQSTGAPATGTDPSTLVNMVGIALDSGDTTFSVMHNDGAGVATEVPLGANYPWAANEIYRLSLWAAKNGSDMGYAVERLTPGSENTARGTLSANLPVNTQNIVPHFWADNGPTAALVEFDVIQFAIEISL